MTFDWIRFFETHKIAYVTSGPNVSQGRIAIHCPWCGLDDPSEHLSVRLDTGGFVCWRNKTNHWGTHPEKLIQALLGCTWDEANRLAGNVRELPSDFLAAIKSKFVPRSRNSDYGIKLALQIPKEFKSIGKLPSAELFRQYLRSRGFDEKDIEGSGQYGIFYASQGSYKGRIIFTVRADRTLVGWTGRTIYPIEAFRYKTLTHDARKARDRGEIPACGPISDYLYLFDDLCSCDAATIVLVEGPFDAWKTNILGKPLGVVSTCFFTSTLSDQQTNILHGLLPRFKNKFLLLDHGTFTKSAKIKADLAALGVQVRYLPPAYKDPAVIPSSSALHDILWKSGLRI